MRLKLRERSEITAPLKIRDQWIVDVAHLTMKERQELGDRCNTREVDAVTGAIKETFSDEKWKTFAPAAYVRGWKGLSRDTLSTLVDAAELPEADDVPFDAELCAQLWAEIPPDVFALPVVRFSQRVLEARELQKKTTLTSL